jgi:hypothetical protein
MLWPGETFVDFAHGLNTSIRELPRRAQRYRTKGKALPPDSSDDLFINLLDDFRLPRSRDAF